MSNLDTGTIQNLRELVEILQEDAGEDGELPATYTPESGEFQESEIAQLRSLGVFREQDGVLVINVNAAIDVVEMQERLDSAARHNRSCDL